MTSIDFRGLLMAALPHAVAVVLMVLAAGMVFPPVMYEGKELTKTTFAQHTMTKETGTSIVRGRQPHWTDSTGGMPTIQVVASDVFSVPKNV